MLKLPSDGSVKIELRGNVAVITLNRPPHNHVSVDLIHSLADALTSVDQEPELRCSVMQTEGPTFCAGAELAKSEGGGGFNISAAGALYEGALRLFGAQKPIVAAVQGGAIGAGLGLAVMADFRIAAPEARFSANFVKLGFHPGFGLTHTLPRLIGHAKADLMCLTGRRVKPEEALRWGLVDEITSSVDLRSAAFKLASEIGENAPLAIIATRRTLRQDLVSAVCVQTDRELQEQRKLQHTRDFEEGVRAVAERRPGKFTGS